MISYAVVHRQEKIDFEKRHHLPYGYNNVPIFKMFGDAMKWFNSTLGPNERKEWVIEKHESGTSEVVFRIF
jgi:hypothetical protein